VTGQKAKAIATQGRSYGEERQWKANLRNFHSFALFRALSRAKL